MSECVEWMKSSVNMYCWQGHDHAEDLCLSPMGVVKPFPRVRLTVSEVQCIITIVGHGGVQVDLGWRGS